MVADQTRVFFATGSTFKYKEQPPESQSLAQEPRLLLYHDCTTMLFCKPSKKLPHT